MIESPLTDATLIRADPHVIDAMHQRAGLRPRAGACDGRIRRRVAVGAIEARAVDRREREVGEGDAGIRLNPSDRVTPARLYSVRPTFM